VSFQPTHQVKSPRLIELDRVAVKQIGHGYEVPVCRKLVSNELRVDESVTDDIREDENSMLRRSVLRI
jgi:hypothetical protein